MLMVPEPPPAPYATDDALTEGWQRSGVGEGLVLVLAELPHALEISAASQTNAGRAIAGCRIISHRCKERGGMIGPEIAALCRSNTKC
jgi:hypothetical protein